MKLIERATILSREGDPMQVRARGHLALLRLQDLPDDQPVPVELVVQLLAGVLTNGEDAVLVDEHGNRVYARRMDDGVRITDRMG